MNLLLELVSSPWFWVDILLSVTGGIVVYWGLLIEKRAEKYIPPESFKPDIFEDVVAAQKSELQRGWRILMTGIILEVVAALGISIISGLEVADLKDKTAAANRESKIAGKDAALANERAANLESTNLQMSVQVEGLRSNNLVLQSNVFALEITLAQIRTNVSNLDPITGPVRTAEARVFFALAKPVLAKNHNEGMKCAWLRLWRPGKMVGIDLMTDLFSEQIDSRGEQKFSLDFRLTPDEAGFGGGAFPRNGISASDMVKALDTFNLDLWFLPQDAEIVRGFVAIRVNSILDKEFPIPPQKIGNWHSLVGPIEMKVKDFLPVIK